MSVLGSDVRKYFIAENLLYPIVLLRSLYMLLKWYNEKCAHFKNYSRFLGLKS